ncbi:cysteine-rich with EGF-like domain protein 2 [Hippocampus comes]|uniref:Cysteine-rich with EGF-like domains 2 n=1 Tax=Hippocampus comes TaxID=109280 RepID=A0A3Q2ZBQ2_HIPCM|nr:PREDICTED: cysteine-rich with EGF-like domain protein 2 [Hippocampus comes]
MLPSSPELRLLGLLSCFIFIFQVTNAKRDLKSACGTCQRITDNFQKGYERTAKQNFGGGNTAWEERKLSKYETSEIRLMEIVEGLCDSSSFECNQMLEEHEELLETWWFKRKTKHPDLHKWFCIDTIEVCCPKGTFGPDCNACVGGSERPCHGNGKCDGDGTRGGDGKCTCDVEYKGDFCLDCIDGYFNEVRNDSFSLCTECHSSCKTCSDGATHQDCDECKDGWEEDEQEACIDVNECSKDSPPCQEKEYCVNTEGSYSCKGCDQACTGCTGAGADKCKACAGGYQDTEGTCSDIDECSGAEPMCTEEHQQCVNTSGDYKCVCSAGYEDHDGECVQKPQEEEPAVSKTDESPHVEL